MAVSQLTRIELLARMTEALASQDDALINQELSLLGSENEALKNIALALIMVMSTQGKQTVTLAEHTALLEKIEGELNAPTPDDVAVSARFVVITRRNPLTGEVIKMPQTLVNDATSNIPVEFDNLAGLKVPAPAGGALTFTATDAAGAPVTFATVAMGADGSSVDVTPVPHDGTLVDPVATAFTITMDDTSGMMDIKAPLDCNFGADPNAASGHFVTTGITTRPVV